jgi:GMP synthase-like glutamine amidotransferase
VPYEGPGLIGAEAEAAGVRLEPIRAWEGDPVPRVADVAGIVAMGGPMSVNDVAEHDWIDKEVELLANALAAEMPVLGVCLGAQLTARALGCEVRPSECEEVGAGEVEVTPAGRADPLLRPCGDRLEVFHWHGETFSLPPGAETLASTPGCPNQAFRAGEHAWALQFHVEVDAALADAWAPMLPAGVELDADDVARLEGPGRAVVRRFLELAAG